jgi:hypothetical protein
VGLGVDDDGLRLVDCFDKVENGQNLRIRREVPRRIVARGFGRVAAGDAFQTRLPRAAYQDGHYRRRWMSTAQRLQPLPLEVPAY